MSRIGVVGSLNMDLIVQAEHIPAPGETILGSDLKTAAGGKGANQAVAAARLGAEVTMVGRVGQDAYGDTLRGGLWKDRVEGKYVKRDDEAPTGVALIILNAEAQNAIVVSPGANRRLSPEDVAAAAGALRGMDVLVLQLEIPLETVTVAARLAHENGVRVVLNPAPARPLPPALLACVDDLILNETETEILTGLPVKTEAELQAAVERLLELGVKQVVLTLGERGAMYISRQERQRVPAFKVTAVDTTAAGDAFVGAFAVAMAEKQTPDAALRFACAAGACAVTRLGAQPSLPTLDEVRALL